jgi:creatinine amidohydrolase
MPRPVSRNGDWNDARNAASLETDNHDDMHGGEAETSILLAVAPEVVRSSYVDADFDVHDRRYLLTSGISGYTKTGIIGRPSLASAEKGEALLRAFSSVFQNHLAQLQ